MKDKIIMASIECMKKEGLRFSVDSLASNLKISKKTIYKYFSDKEALAIALYQKVFCDALTQANTLSKQNTLAARAKLLQLYFDCKWMTRHEVFNKYMLNQSIHAYTAEQLDALWVFIAASFYQEASEPASETLRMIVDGSFEKLCTAGLPPDGVIEKLVHLS